MTGYDQESLDAMTWFERMGRFVEGLSQDHARPDRHIRKAYHLHCLAPDALKPMMAAPVEEARMEAMLECGAFESAVTSLIGTAGRVAVSSGAGGGIEVCMSVGPGLPEDNPANDAWPIAMLEAWAESFLRLRPLPH